jgi:hypothetical protein
MSSLADAAEASAGAAEGTAAGGLADPVPLGLALQAVLAVCVVAIAAIGTYNAWSYPARFGYDWGPHSTYALDLIQHGRLPSQGIGSEYYTPPGFYAIAGVMLWVGQHLGMAHPEHLMQQLDVVFVLATAWLLFLTARMLFPRRPLVWVSSVGFLAFLPVVTRVEGMFHPETTNMLAATAATTLAVWMIVRRRFGKREIAALAVLLAFDQLVRASGIFTFAAVAIALVVTLLGGRFDRRQGLRTLAFGAAALILLVSPWYARQAIKYHTLTPINVVPGFARQMLHPGSSIVESEGGLAHYFDFPILEIYRHPYREYFLNEAFSESYADTWGDWIGSWEWDLSGPPTAREVRILRNQMLIGAIPTLLALGGLGWMLVAGLRRRRELLPVALLVPIAFAGFYYRSYVQASNDGDLIKAAYMLLTAPAWALAFGVAFERVTRNRWTLIGLGSLLAVFAVLELPVLVWGVRVGRFL